MTSPPSAEAILPMLPVPDAELAVLYCRARDVVCAYCRYSLRSATTHVCPECGRPNTIGDLVTGDSRSPTRTSWFLTLAFGIGGFLLKLTLALVGAGIAFALVLPRIERGQMPWLVGGVAIVAAAAAWLGLLYVLARWIRVPFGSLRRLRSGPGRSRGRVLATLTAPRWMQRTVLPLTILLTLLIGFVGAQMVYFSLTFAAGFAGGGPGYFISELIYAFQYVCWFCFCFAAMLCCVARMRRRDNPLRDGVVIGWLMMNLVAVPILTAVQLVLSFVL